MKNIALEKFVNEILSGIKTASEFANQQLPAIAQQALTYRLYSDICGIIAAICALLFVRTIFVKIKRWSKSIVLPDEDNVDFVDFLLTRIVPGFALIMICMIPVSCIWDDVQEILKIVYAPKLYLLEYIAHLIK